MTIDQIPVDALDDASREGVIALRIPADDGDYPVLLSASWDFEIISVEYQSNAGTCNLVFNVDGTPVVWSGGDSTLGLSSSPVDETVTSAGSVSAGDVVEAVISSSSGATLAAADLYIRRT